MKKIEKDQESKQDTNTEIYLKKKKNKKRKYGRNGYHNMSKEKKEILKQYQQITMKLKNF